MGFFGFGKKKGTDDSKSAPAASVPSLAQTNASTVSSANIGSSTQTTPQQSTTTQTQPDTFGSQFNLPDLPPMPQSLDGSPSLNASTKGGALPELPSFDSNTGLNSSASPSSPNSQSSTQPEFPSFESSFNTQQDAKIEKPARSTSTSTDMLPSFDELPDFDSPEFALGAPKPDASQIEQAVSETQSEQAENGLGLPSLDEFSEEQESQDEISVAAQKQSNSYSSDLPPASGLTGQSYKPNQKSEIYLDAHSYSEALADVAYMRDDIKHIHENSDLISRDELIERDVDSVKKELLLAKSLLLKVDNVLFMR